MGIYSYVEEPVFVTIVEIPEQPEKGRQIRVRSVVRLCPLDLCPHCCTQTLDSPFLVGKLPRTITNGELDNLSVGGKQLAALMDQNAEKQMIQGATQVVNTIPSHQGPFIERGTFVNLDEYTVAAAIRITLSHSSIRISFPPQNNFSPESIQTFLCPPEFQPATSEFGSECRVILRT